jgi:hypothetical protein
MSDTRYPCPCCGHLVFTDPPGSDDICLVCFWQDDLMQLRWPQLGGATNVASLETAQRNFARFGASEERFVRDVRAPTADEPLDPEWRPIRESDPFESPDDSAPWPEDRTRLYYWRPTFWRLVLH